MLTFKQVVVLVVVVQVFVYIFVSIANLILPNNRKPLSKTDIDKIIKNCPSCASPMYESGAIEPNK